MVATGTENNRPNPKYTFNNTAPSEKDRITCQSSYFICWKSILLVIRVVCSLLLKTFLRLGNIKSTVIIE